VLLAYDTYHMNAGEATRVKVSLTTTSGDRLSLREQYYNLLHSFNLIIKQRRYKLRTVILMGMLALISSISCSKEDKPETEAKIYYVKYEVSSSTPYIGKLDVTVTAEDGNYSIAEGSYTRKFIIDTHSSWEAVIGPVSRGFNAHLKVSIDDYYNVSPSLYTQISVSKDSGPFVVRQIDGSDEPRRSVDISYTLQ
jgi:hypothetical protein